ncbi:hypothetical protein [Algivirga pacifica]|uniref:DUF3592 domain-containing protein n=1 Tax=Algivirga pacifica TaxID=1162670 RepID=A0ABP9DM71_9BACT
MTPFNFQEKLSISFNHLKLHYGVIVLLLSIFCLFYISNDYSDREFEWRLSVKEETTAIVNQVIPYRVWDYEKEKYLNDGYAYIYTFEHPKIGFIHMEYGYTEKQMWKEGDQVTIAYVKDNPYVNLPKGYYDTRSNFIGYNILIILILGCIVFIIQSWRNLRKIVGIVEEGAFVLARLRTHKQITPDEGPVQHVLVFVYTVDDKPYTHYLETVDNPYYLTDEKREVMFYQKGNPEKVYLLDEFPSSYRQRWMEENGEEVKSQFSMIKN